MGPGIGDLEGLNANAQVASFFHDLWRWVNKTVYCLLFANKS